MSCKHLTLDVNASALPFISVRNMGSGAKNQRFTEAIFSANDRYPGLVDEIWFGGVGGSLYHPETTTTEVIEPQLRYREECAKRGILFSLQQGPTLGYDGQRTVPAGVTLPDDCWAMTPDGRRHPGVFCPTSPDARKLNYEVAKAVIGGLKPYSYWPDDDLRLSKRNNRICFCDRCIKKFNERTGRKLSRAELDAALYGKPGDKSIRADWIEHNLHVLAEFASVYREAADAAYPECRLGLQHMNSDAEHYSCEYSGGTPRLILEALRGAKAPQVGYRPGYAFYGERRPRDMFRKAYEIMVSTTTAAKYGFVDSMCHEAENWPHVAAEKNPNTQMVENSLALAAGCNSLSLYWGSDHYGEEPEVWSYYFDCLAKWKPFFLAIVKAVEETVPCGVSEFRGSDEYALDSWLNRSDGTELRLFENSIPVACEGGNVGAFFLTAARIGAVTQEDLPRLFAKTVIMDVQTWTALVKKFPSFPAKGAIVFDDSAGRQSGALAIGTMSEEFPGGYRSADIKQAIRSVSNEVKEWSSVTGAPDLCGTCSFPSGFGGKIVLVQQMFAWFNWSGPKRRAILDALEEASPDHFRVRLMTGGYQVAVIVRTDESGNEKMVYLLNPTCGESPALELRLPGSAANWRLRTIDGEYTLESVRSLQSGTVVRIPPLKAWEPVLLCRATDQQSTSKLYS